MKSNFSELQKQLVFWLLQLLGFLSAPLITRLMLIYSRASYPQYGDTAGFLSDVGIALLAFLIYNLIAKHNKIVASLVIIVWFMFHYSNYEHVLANGDIVSLSYAKYLLSPTFLFGSALVVSNMFLTVAIILTSFAILFVKPVRLTMPIIIIILVFAGTGIFSRSLFATVIDARWRSYNVIHANMEDIFCSTFNEIDLTIDSTTEARYKSVMKKDLGGTPDFIINRKKNNVLIIALEGACGALLSVNRDHHAVESDITMQKLDSIARENIVYTNFITHQRQTNRGMFCILSGNYPKLNSSTPKMTEYVTKKNLDKDCGREFLPQFLARNGYETTYLQGSPLPYMLKDVFMKQAGFQNCYGTTWFKYSYSSNYWGVDDKAFFEQAADLIVSRKRMKKPWFMTLLTVGTHHPLNIPADYGDVENETLHQRAYQYLDESLAAFFKRLDDAGILKKTLVILTCDESQGICDNEADTPGKRFCQQWGLLIVLHPTEKKRVVTTKVTQFDLALSVADYLGLPAGNTPFGGRSIFRTYQEDRDIYFANTYNHIIGKFTKDNMLEICDENFNYGERYTIPGNKLFSLNRQLKHKLTKEEITNIARFGKVSNSSVIDLANSNNRTFDFRSGISQVISDSNQITLLGGQFFTIPKNSAVSVHLKGRVTTSDTGIVFLKHDLAAKSGKVRIVKYMPKELRARETFSTTYDFYTTEEYYSSEFRVTAELKQGSEAVIILDEASLSYTVRPPTPAEKKTFVKRFDRNVGRDLGAFILVEHRDSTATVKL